MFFEIFDEIIFFAHFEIVSEMVDSLIWMEPFLIDLIESILLAPYDIPVITPGFFIASDLKGFIDTSGKIGFILDLMTIFLFNKYICD